MATREQRARWRANSLARKRAAHECEYGGCHVFVLRGPYCREHRGHNTRGVLSLQHRRKREGKCVQCEQSRLATSRFCKEHHGAKLKNYRARRPPCATCGSPDHTTGHGHKSAGLCGACDEPRTHPRSRPLWCERHYDDNRRAHRSASLVAVAVGICRQCRRNPIAATSKSRCEHCLEVARNSQKGVRAA